jgi:4-hydroxy-4-methyl-2-oxoglutarate aldolase
MIEEPPLLEMAREIRRPSPDVVERFRSTPTSFITDAMGGSGAMDWRIKPIGAVFPMVGVALTCDCGPADNLALGAAIAQCQPGDVLVAAAGGYTGTAVVGDLLLGIARNRGAAGLVTDGLVRDLDDIAQLGFACFAMGATPNSPHRNGPGTVGRPVMCGGAQVSSGDIIVGDRDGVVVVPQRRIDEVLVNLVGVREAEAALLAKVRGGVKEVGFVSAIISGGRVRHIES